MLYITPSRGRPHNAAELIAAWEATSTLPESRLWIAVDDDDSTLREYEALTLPSWATLSVAPRKRLGPTLNDWSHVGLKLGFDQIGFMGDDHRPRTHGWDAEILRQMKLIGPGVYYGNDLLQGANLPTAVVMSADIVATLGYFCPPGLLHLYLDDAWKRIGEHTQLIYLPNIVIEHLHPVAGKAGWDDLYREVNSGQRYEEDGAAYRSWLASGDAPGGWRERLSALR